MSGFIFKLMAYTLCFNFAIGIMLQAIPAFGDSTNPDFDPTYSAGLTYTADYSHDFNTQMNGSVNPSKVLETSSFSIVRIIDTVVMGLLKRFMDAILTYAYGFIVFMDKLIGGYLPLGLHTLLFTKPLGILYDIVSVGYFIAGFNLWTGRDVP